MADSAHEEDRSPLTFEERVVDRFRSLIKECCKETPELDQVAVIFDWSDGLNEGATAFVVGDAEGPLSIPETTKIAWMMSQLSKLGAWLASMLRESTFYHLKQVTELLQRRTEPSGGEEGTGEEGLAEGEATQSGEQTTT